MNVQMQTARDRAAAVMQQYACPRLWRGQSISKPHRLEKMLRYGARNFMSAEHYVPLRFRRANCAECEVYAIARNVLFCDIFEC